MSFIRFNNRLDVKVELIFHIQKIHIRDSSREKGPYGNCEKYRLVRLRSPRRLTTTETFRYWQISSLLSDNSTYLKGGYLDFSHLTELRNIYISLKFR